MSGLDLSPQNIAFLRERAAAKRLEPELLVADMTRFKLRRPVDAAICMQDSQGHLLTNEALLATVRATFEALKDLNPVTQTFYEDMELEAHEDGVRRVYRQRHASRMVFPQELRALVQLAGGFELVEWFYGFKPHLRLDRAHHPLLMVVVLRKR